MTTIYFVPFCIGYIRELILVIGGRKPFEPHRVLVYAAAMVGFILMMIMNYSGHSQIYFGLVTVFLVPMIALWFVEDLEDSRDSSALAKHTLDTGFDGIEKALAHSPGHNPSVVAQP